MQRNQLVGVFRFVDAPLTPVRAYVHTSGYELFETPAFLEGAAYHLRETLRSRHTQQKMEKAAYTIALMWGDVKTQERVIDFCVHRFEGEISSWKTLNPEILIWNTREGRHAAGSYEKLCGDGAIILGQEELLRRSSKSLSEYFVKRDIEPFMSSTLATALGCNDDVTQRGFSFSQELQCPPHLQAHPELKLYR